MSMVALLALLLSTFILSSNADGNVTCSGTGMDWYTNHVGETACKTYERLRQICNSDFEVGNMTVNTPPDICDDQNADCCCNSIAFALAMLCLNCQQNIGTGNGYDAGVGAYEDYLQGDLASGFCSPVHNQTLSTSVQDAVCNEDIKIFDSLYTLFWSNGAWYYIYTEETISEDIAAENNNTFTHCASTTINTTSSVSSSALSTSASSSSTSSITPSDDLSSSSSLSGGAIGGIAVGVVVGLAGFALMLWFMWWKRRGPNKPVTPENHIEPFTADTREAYGRSGDPYPTELIAGYSTQSITTPSPLTGYPAHIGMQSSSGYGDSSMGARSNFMPSGSSSQLEKRPRSNQNSSILPTTATTSDLPFTASAASLLSPGHSFNQSLGEFTVSEPERDVDGGRVPQEMLDGRLPPAYGDQID